MVEYYDSEGAARCQAAAPAQEEFLKDRDERLQKSIEAYNAFVQTITDYLTTHNQMVQSGISLSGSRWGDSVASGPVSTAAGDQSLSGAAKDLAKQEWTEHGDALKAKAKDAAKVIFSKLKH